MTGRPFNAVYPDDPDYRAYRVEVDTGEGIWYANALTFHVEQDAYAYAADLLSRWTAVKRFRVVPVDTPIRERVES